jgi:hypothetical protein
MQTYRHIWLVVASALTALGLSVAVAAWPPEAVLTFFLLATVVAAGTASVTSEEGEGLPWRKAVKAGVLAGAAVVGAGGLIDLLGAWGFTLVVLTTAACPALVQGAIRLASRLDADATVFDTPTLAVDDEWFADDPPERPVDRPRSTPALVFPPAADEAWMGRPVETMDDAALCLAWRSSYVALQQVCSLPRELRIIERRQELLDELERRNARGFSAWLASCPRAAGDPSKYLEEPRARHRPPPG